MSKVDGKFEFSPISVNFLTEAAKVLFAVVMLLLQVQPTTFFSPLLKYLLNGTYMRFFLVKGRFQIELLLFLGAISVKFHHLLGFSHSCQSKIRHHNNVTQH